MSFAENYLGVNPNDLAAFVAVVGENILVAFNAIPVDKSEWISAFNLSWWSQWKAQARRVII